MTSTQAGHGGQVMGYITSPVILQALILPTDAKAKGEILCVIIHKEIQILVLRSFEIKSRP